MDRSHPSQVSDGSCQLAPPNQQYRQQREESLQHVQAKPELIHDRLSGKSAGPESASASESENILTLSPMPPATKRQKLDLRSVTRYLAADVRDDLFLEAQLIVLAFATGIQDAATYPDFRCFASNQTGNTVLLAVGYAGFLDPAVFVFRNTWISLGCFVMGALFAGQISNWVGRRRRITCIVSSTIQTIFVIGSAIIDYMDAARRHRSTAELMFNFNWHTDGGRPYTRTKMAGLGMLSFSSGAQVAMARAVGINEITTAMATSAYVDLLVDPAFFVPANRSRNRRVVFLMALFAGSFAGAFAAAAYGLHFAILLSAVGKALVTIALFFNKEEKRPAAEIDQEDLKS